jgi:hypothetical protein
MKKHRSRMNKVNHNNEHMPSLCRILLSSQVNPCNLNLNLNRKLWLIIQFVTEDTSPAIGDGDRDITQRMDPCLSVRQVPLKTQANVMRDAECEVNHCK